MLDTYKYKGRIKCPICSKDAPSVGLCPHCGCSTDCRTSPPMGDVAASGLLRESDKCPNCGYLAMNYLYMIETDAHFRVCPICTYIATKEGKVYFEGINPDNMVISQRPVSPESVGAE